MPDIAGSAALDTAIGLAFLFVLLALIASGINELIASVLSLRAKNLEAQLRRLLDPPVPAPGAPSSAELLVHPLVEPLRTPKKRAPGGLGMPSYIPSPVFASALLDLLMPEKPDGDWFAKLDAKVTGLPAGRLKSALEVLIRDAQGDRDRLRRGIEEWYDSTMDRVSGWYKRRSQKILLVIGIVLAIGCNADAMQVATSLWTSPAQRSAVVSAATTADAELQAAKTDDEQDRQLNSLADNVASVDALKLPLGWSNQAGDPRNFPEGWGILWKLVGLLITAGAICLGAPFWFDLIGRGVAMRSAGKKPPRASPA